MTKKLLKEERLIVKMLSLYECLRHEQLVTLLEIKGKDTASAEKMLLAMKKNQTILEDGAGYAMLDLRSKPNQKTISAFWILLQYLPKIDENQHFAANYPSEIFFLKDSKQYEIVVLGQDDAHLVRMLFLENRNSSDEIEDITKYIVVVPNVDSIEIIAEKIPADVLENKQVRFATINYNGVEYGEQAPNIEYYEV